jgi:hypothetical protein
MAWLTVVAEHVLALVASVRCLVVVLASICSHCMMTCRFDGGSAESS